MNESIENPTHLTWKVLHPNRCKVTRDGTATLVGNRVYSFAELDQHHLGGVQDLTSWTWQWLELEEFTLSGRYDLATELADDKLYLYGGKTSSREYLNELIEFDIVTGNARLIDAEGGPGKRGCMSAVWVPWRREIIFFGGIKPAGQERRCNDTFGFNVDKQSWTEVEMKGTPPSQRTGHSALLFGWSMYIYGGYTSANDFLNDIVIANFRRNQKPWWSTPQLRGTIPPGRTVAAFNCVNGKIICFGGYSDYTHVRHSLAVFNPEEKLWASPTDDSVVVEGDAPLDTTSHIGLTVNDGVIYFTKRGVYKLTAKS